MIGIFGGTFDPVHYGHLRTALDVREAAGLEQVRLVPLRGAVHRAQPATPGNIRLAMVQAAVAGTAELVVDDRELSRGGQSYTYDTLVSMRRDLGGEKPLALILGADAFGGFLSWHRPLDILGLAHVIVMERPGHVLGTGGELGRLVSDRRVADAAALAGSASGSILPVEVTQLEISATDIRARVGAGRSIRYLVPEPVETIIRELGLYLA
jgi:nicotinate-nucleotide adenylyltransferase